MEIKDRNKENKSNAGCALTVLVMFFAGLLTIAYDGEKGSLEVKERIIPECRLTTDGKTIDTIFVYKIN